MASERKAAGSLAALIASAREVRAGSNDDFAWEILPALLDVAEAADDLCTGCGLEISLTAALARLRQALREAL